VILAFLLLTASQAAATIPCSSDDSSLPYPMCVAEQRSEAAQAELEQVLELARKSAMDEREAYLEREKSGVRSTLDADEVGSLEVAQELWRVSMEADCLLVATAFKRAVTSNVPHEERMKCEADRTIERITFLKHRYGLREDVQ
jgi:uncharacterized protein YecT (DUF1311 family)